MNFDKNSMVAMHEAQDRARDTRRLLQAAPVMMAVLEKMVDAHTRGVSVPQTVWREAIGALAQAKGG